MESPRAEGQLSSWKGHRRSLGGPVAFEGLHVCRPEEYGNDDATTDTRYHITLKSHPSLVNQLIINSFFRCTDAVSSFEQWWVWLDSQPD